MASDTIYVRGPHGVVPCIDGGTCGVCQVGVIDAALSTLCMACGAQVAWIGDVLVEENPAPDIPSVAGLGEGASRKEEGIAKVEFNQPEWRDRLRMWITERAAQPGDFSSDDLYRSIEPPDGWNKSTQNSVGAAFSWANKARMITMVGFKNSERASAHSRKIPVYVGAAVQRGA